MSKTYIDIEPTWETLCKLAQDGHLPPKELMQACIVADIVRQAEKSGKKYIKFVFDNGISVLTNEDEEHE